MVASHAPAATFGLTLRPAASAVWIRLVLAALVAAALAVTGVVLAFSLPHSNAASPGSFLGPTPTTAQP
jgi:hypothetical protein